MKVRVKFFAAMREALDNTEIELDLPLGATVQQLVNLVAERYPVLCPYLGSALIAVNQRYAPAQTELQPGDEVAFVPPVGGG